MRKLILFILSLAPLALFGQMKVVQNITSGIVISSTESFPVRFCTVFTDPDVIVNTYSNEGGMNTAINSLSASLFPPLPESGTIRQDYIYSYGGLAFRCVQEHERTIYEPLITPALFAVYRENNDELDWTENENVLVGWKRTYNGQSYECLQSHLTLLSWVPTNTLGILWRIAQSGDVDCETSKEWNVSDNWTTYTLGDKRTNAGKLWECINVAYSYYEPSGAYGHYGWKYLKDCP